MLNSVYITVGVALILAILVALVGPFFIDWTAYRASFESYGTKVLGHRVAVMGDADMRLLPTPTLTFTDVRVGEAEDPLLAISRFSMRIELPPLLKGEIRVIDMRLEQPRLRLALDESGRLDWFTAAPQGGMIARIDPDQVLVEQMEVVEGTLTLVDARSGKTHRVKDVNALVSARSLVGPYRLDGTATVGDAAATVRLATGRRDEAGAIRVKTQVTPASLPFETLTDGTLSVSGERPLYEGTYTLKSVTPDDMPEQAWVAEGAFSLGVDALALNETVLRYGPEEHPLTFEGALKVDLLGEPRFDLSARAKQIDVDRLAGAGPQQPLSLGKAVEAGLAALRAVPHPPVPGRVRIAVPATVVGGGILQDFALDAETIASGWRVVALNAQLPGRAQLRASGDLVLRPDLGFRGQMSASVEQPNGFADWWRKGVTLAEPVAPFSLEGRLDATASGVAFTDLAFSVAGHTGRGVVSYRRPEQGPARFEADLDAERLDLDQVGLLARLFVADDSGTMSASMEDDVDVSLRLFADTLAAGGIEAHQVAVDALFASDTLTIRDLTVRDLAGADLTASGRIEDLSGAPRGDFSAEIDAAQLDGLAALLRRHAPGAAADRFAALAPALSPARLTLGFAGTGDGQDTNAQVELDGRLAGSELSTHLSLKGRLDAWRSARIEGDAELKGEDAGVLLRQLGADLLPVAALGAGSITLGASGVPQEGLNMRLRLGAGDASLLAVGTVAFPQDAPVRYGGDIVVKAEDLVALALMTGRMPPLLAGDTAIDVAMTVEGIGDRFSIERLAGTVGAARIEGGLTGDLRRVIPGAVPQLSGTLTLSRLGLALVSELALGADLWSSSTDGSWPQASFAAPVIDGVDLDLRLGADVLDIGRGIKATAASGRLRLKPGGALTLQEGKADLAGGQIAGTFAIRRSGGEAGINGALRITDADLAAYVWTRQGRPLATGRFDLNAEFDGTGRSVAGIVSSLGGGGTFTIKDGEIRSLNPDAFGLVIRAADAGLDLTDEEIRKAFASHLDTGVLPFDTIEGTFSITGGVARMRNVSVDNEEAALFGNAQADLESGTLESDFSLRVDPGENAVTGADPQVGLVFSGPIEAPSRQIDIAPFTAFLTLRAFEQEVRRVEALQADILERERLMRELKRLRQIESRKEREAEEQRRAAEEAARRAAEEAARLAAEEDARRRAAEEAARGEAPPTASPLSLPDVVPGPTPLGTVPAPQPAAPAGAADDARASPSTVAPLRSSTAASPDPHPVLAPQEPVNNSPEQDFRTRIRAAIDAVSGAVDGGEGSVAPAAPGAGTEDLPPLDAPIEVAPAPGFDAEARETLPPSEPAVAGPVGRDPRPTRRTPARPAPQRFITLPNGVLVPVPDP